MAWCSNQFGSDFTKPLTQMNTNTLLGNGSDLHDFPSNSDQAKLTNNGLGQIKFIGRKGIKKNFF